MKDNFKLVIDSLHVQDDLGDLDNVRVAR
jgi:hypothetical protein